MKIAINTCYGEFSLSKKAYKYLGLKWGVDDCREFIKNRTNSKLIECIEKLGKDSYSHMTRLKIIDIPENIEYEITSDCGVETVREIHRSWSWNYNDE